MACGKYWQSMAQPSDAPDSRLVHPSSSSSHIDWQAPRISFSKDFTRPGAHSISHDTMRETSEISESPARLSSSKSSPSEFEFSMCNQGHDSSHENTMLAADELFCDGKLLPLYTNPQGAPSGEPNIVGQRRSSAEQYIRHGHSEPMMEMGRRMKIDQNPISPKAPTCTSRWKELLGLKKVQNQDVKDVSNGSKQLKKSVYSGNGVAPGRRSLDSVKDSKARLSHNDAHIRHDIKSSRQTLSHHETLLYHHGGHGTFQGQNHGEQMHHLSQLIQCEPLLPTTDPGLCPTTYRKALQMDRAMSGSRSSKSSEDSDSSATEANGGGATAMVRHRHSASRAQSPAKPREQGKLSIPAMSPRRNGGFGSRGFSPGRPSGVGRATDSSRSAIATRLVVRGLDRSCSSPKPMKKRTEQLRSGRQRSYIDGSRSLERSPSYSTGVRVAPVINVPMYITPGLRKGSKNGIFGLTHLFTSKKDKNPNKRSSSATAHLQQHAHHADD